MDQGPRASDAERERFAAALERHYADGRLTDDEFAERLDRVLSARTLRELYELTSDLPDLPVVDRTRLDTRPPGRRWRRWRA